MALQYASYVAYEALAMISADTRTRSAAPVARRPTEYLLRADSDQLSPVMVYKLIAKGFDLKDVQSMLALSALYSTNKIMSRIVGKSTRTIQRQGNKQPAHLNAQQSAVALQYAKVLEHAINVFGTQKLAEEWLGNPCKYLDGDVPLDVIDNSVGFNTVEDYLERIEYGVYQ
jgi:putative toxin-antitoxin system antitoxin component (TIGR02293 family)